METYRASWKWVAMGGVSAVILCGCVFNPYIRTTTRPSSSNPGADSPQYVDCPRWHQRRTVTLNARDYAYCMRTAMEDKASSYAVMNNGGSALLLGFAGLAGYRAFQGEHASGVAALTTGGAALYGTQQYLYRKPREAIYWSGAAALGCAIGIADKRSLIGDELRKLSAGDMREVDSLSATLGDAAREEARLRPGAKPDDNCSAGLRNRWTTATALVDALKSEASPDALDQRRMFAKRRLERLGIANLFANSDLITATDAIRDTVNRQLAVEQPDPGELAKLLATLKMPALVASPAAEPKTPVPGKKVLDGLRDSLNLTSEVALVRGPSKSKCNLDVNHFAAYLAAVQSFTRAHQDMLRRMEDVEAKLTSLESGAGLSLDSGDTLKLCPVTRSATLTPFALQLPQAGAQKVKQGDSVFVPISGGVAPFSAIPAATTQAGALTATAEVAEDGEFRFKVSADKAAAVGTYAMIANDATGVTRTFQVEVVK